MDTTNQGEYNPYAELKNDIFNIASIIVISLLVLYEFKQCMSVVMKKEQKLPKKIEEIPKFNQIPSKDQVKELKKTLYERGPWELDNTTGEISSFTFIRLKKIVTYYSLKRYWERKILLMSIRIGYMQQEEEDLYLNTFALELEEFDIVKQKVCDEVCQHVGISRAKYTAAFEVVKAKKEQFDMIEMDERDINNEFEQPEKLDLPIEVVTQVYQFYTELE